ncbi:MAG: hypothetical protein JWR26_728 [Pedosphaera sp.]|nr:hypothetical protein [Pedosphaera sp.]
MGNGRLRCAVGMGIGLDAGARLGCCARGRARSAAKGSPEQGRWRTNRRRVWPLSGKEPDGGRGWQATRHDPGVFYFFVFAHGHRGACARVLLGRGPYLVMGKREAALRGWRGGIGLDAGRGWVAAPPRRRSAAMAGALQEGSKQVCKAGTVALHYKGEAPRRGVGARRACACGCYWGRSRMGGWGLANDTQQHGGILFFLGSRS